MGDQFVELDKCPGIDEEVDSFASRELAGVVLSLDATFSATFLGPFV